MTAVQDQNDVVTLYFAPSSEPKSMLSRLTPEELEAWSQWMSEHPGRNGMEWPGWATSESFKRLIGGGDLFAHEGEVKHTVVIGPSGSGMSVDYSALRLAEAEVAKVKVGGTMPDNLKELLKSIPQQPQRQDSTNAQLRDLAAFANRLGLYDAADSIRSQIGDR